MTTIAILHPGHMGAVVGHALKDRGHRVLWLPAGRGRGTRRRAQEAGLSEAESVDGCDVVISVCPPEAALRTAEGLQDFTGLYLDANAVSPITAEQVAAAVRARGADYVDGAIIGPPPISAGTTRLYLSGARSAEIVELFTSSRLAPIHLPGGEFDASAVKMVYAAYTKISAALLVSLGSTARRLGVEDALLNEWTRSQPGLDRRLDAARGAAESKGWRWEGEMREISRTFAAVDEPPGFADAAAALFGRWSRPVDE